MDQLREDWDLSEDQDLEGYAYIDATMNGAPYPVYFLIDNMKFEKIS